jgi:hypothetical protein
MSNPNLNKLPYTTGVANGVTITFLAGADDFASASYVTLKADYARVIPPGYPDPNPGVQIQTSFTAFPQTIPGPGQEAGTQTIPAGTRLQVRLDEAQALVAAGAATYS